MIVCVGGSGDPVLDETRFRACCECRTGYPIVDAAMRQLNQTGWMHNRARMIVASYLCKDALKACIHPPWLMSIDQQKRAQCVIGIDYPQPIVDHSEQRKLVLSRFKEIRS